MNELEHIEEQFNFKYPKIYQQLYKDGMLDWYKGWNEPWTKERNWHTEIYPALLKNPPLLLHANIFEILKFEDILISLNNIPAYWDKQHKFIPFAENGAGDQYAFYYNLKNGDDVPIVLVPHDDENAYFMAKNLNDFIFRKMIEVVNDINEEVRLKEDSFRTNLLSMLNSHRSYLPAEQQEILEKVYNMPVKEYHYSLENSFEYKAFGMLDNHELEQLLMKNINFDKLDKEFLYQIQ